MIVWASEGLRFVAPLALLAMTARKYLTQPFEVFEDKKASTTVTY
jgi:hypothetical protein